MNTPIINSGIALAIHTVFIVILLRFCDMNIYAILYSNILFGFLMCIFNQVALKDIILGMNRKRKDIPDTCSCFGSDGRKAFVVYKGVYFCFTCQCDCNIAGNFHSSVCLCGGIAEVPWPDGRRTLFLPERNNLDVYLKRFHLI